MNESEIISNLRQLANGYDLCYGFSDDVARIRLGDDQDLVVSKDMICQDVHFKEEDGGFNIAAKLLRSNLSDIASSGATPRYYLLGYSKNDSLNHQAFFQDFVDGLKVTQNEFGLSLIGGDVVKTRSVKDRLFFSVTIFGTIAKGRSLLRSKAKAGDLIYVTGDIGDAYLGLKINQGRKKFKELGSSDKSYLLNRHFLPKPRVDFAKQLVDEQLSSCACDISDGLIKDLTNICKASKLSSEIFFDQIPISQPAIRSGADKAKIINQGDDYELIFTINPKNQQQLEELADKLNLKISNIGQIKDALNDEYEVKIYYDQNSKSLINNKIFQSGYEH